MTQIETKRALNLRLFLFPYLATGLAMLARDRTTQKPQRFPRPYFPLSCLFRAVVLHPCRISLYPHKAKEPRLQRREMQKNEHAYTRVFRESSKGSSGSRGLETRSTEYNSYMTAKQFTRSNSSQAQTVFNTSLRKSLPV
jgi:hypothetical protein